MPARARVAAAPASRRTQRSVRRSSSRRIELPARLEGVRFELATCARGASTPAKLAPCPGRSRFAMRVPSRRTSPAPIADAKDLSHRLYALPVRAPAGRPARRAPPAAGRKRRAGRGPANRHHPAVGRNAHPIPGRARGGIRQCPARESSRCATRCLGGRNPARQPRFLERVLQRIRSPLHLVDGVAVQACRLGPCGIRNVPAGHGRSRRPRITAAAGAKPRSIDGCANASGYVGRRVSRYIRPELLLVAGHSLSPAAPR